MSFGSARGRCFVEISAETGRPVRIFRGRKGIWEKLADGNLLREWPRKDAVASIRQQVFVRSGGYCEFGGEPITQNFHLHEKKSRGDGGEISLENSVALCADCHLKGEHKERNPQWKKQVQS